MNKADARAGRRRDGVAGRQDTSQNDQWLQGVVHCYEGSLVRYATRLLGDLDRARDVVQDTFLRLCREDIDKIRGAVAPWLFAVCRNRALDIRKKEIRMNQFADGQAQACESPDADPSQVAERRETSQSAIAILNGLPDNQREVIRLKVEHGLSYREISEITGLSQSNVGYLLHKGIKTIREQFVRHSEPA